MIGAMNAPLRSGALGALLAATLLLTVPPAALSQAPRAAPGDSGMVVMSDTPEWCVHLQGKVDELAQVVAKPHAQADRLAREGRHLCAIGRIRLGITRLRYALMHLEALQQAGQAGP